MSVGILVDIGKSLTSFKNEFASIELDVMMEESHQWQNEVTTNPVETGQPISDHIQIVPDTLSITGMVSDSSISDSVVKRFSGIDDAPFQTRQQTAFDMLLKMKNDRKLVTVYTKYKIYKDMAIRSISIPRNNQVGDSIEFSIEFVNVRIVTTGSVDLPKGISAKPAAKANKSIQNKTKPTDKTGAKPAKPVPAPKAPDATGIIASIVNYAKGF